MWVAATWCDVGKEENLDDTFTGKMGRASDIALQVVSQGHIPLAFILFAVKLLESSDNAVFQ